jgi:hypothetical protein
MSGSRKLLASKEWSRGQARGIATHCLYELLLTTCGFALSSLQLCLGFLSVYQAHTPEGDGLPFYEIHFYLKLYFLIRRKLKESNAL